MIAKNITKYCCEDISLIENYNHAIADNTQVWQVHHRLEMEDKNGNRLSYTIGCNELKERGLYYNRPAHELIFMTEKDHKSLHEKGNKKALGKNIGNTHALGNHLSEETRKQMGMSRMGNTNNGCTYIKCIETGEIYRTREWIKLGFQNAYAVAKGYQKSCKGYHFAYI